MYVSGEESARQLKLRADRIQKSENPDCYIVCETSLEEIFVHIKNVQPDLVIIDSIQNHIDRDDRIFSGKCISSAGMLCINSQICKKKPELPSY